MYQLYKCQKKKGGSNYIYRVDPLINAKKGNRPDGRKLQRRSKTKLNVDKADRCKVFFILGYDEISYYIKCGYGNNTHNSHGHQEYKNDSNASTKLMNQSQQSILRICDKAKSRVCTDVDLVNAHDNNTYTRYQIRYMKKLVKEVRRLQGNDELGTDTDELLNVFESLQDCRYTILYNNPDFMDKEKKEIY
jgi:hypothetical protein